VLSVHDPTGAMSRDVYHVRRVATREQQMAWYALSNLVDGRGMSWRPIGDPSEANEEETAVPGEQLDGVANPVWDAERQRPVPVVEWYASRPNAPRGRGTPVLVTHVLEGTSREPLNSIGSFGARLTQDHPVPSGEWTKVPFDEVLWDTGGMFDPRHGAFVAPRNMLCGFMAAGHVAIQYAVAIVRLDFALYKNGSLEVEGEGGSGGTSQNRLRSGPTARARNFTPNLVAARTGDVFEIYVRHDVGAEVFLSSKDIDLPDDPQFAAPTANYFMGMYEAH
jgi:hypothetical protein